MAAGCSERICKLNISINFREQPIVLTTAKPFSHKTYLIFVFVCNFGSFQFLTATSCQSKAPIASINLLFDSGLQITALIIFDFRFR